jgi:hypothetical protein
MRDERLVGRERVLDIGENRLAEALRLHHARHLDRLPGADIEIGLVEIRGRASTSVE